MDYAAELSYFKQELQELADPARAVSEKKYLKSALQFYGVSVPKLEKLIKTWLREHKAASIDDLLKLAEKLWDSAYHEEKSLAVFMLVHRANNLTLAHLPFIEKMMGEVNTWAHLDEIAVNLVGNLIDSDPRTLDFLTEWAKSDNFWIRRTAILAQVLQFRRGEGNFDLFSKIVVPMFQEGKHWSKEERFFIRKAIGWALRELAPKRPEIVYNFVQQY
ncbi:MAG: DNA alkylation repair protein, partial [Anaerolineae bacterium]|nr:DNA alkylation repair protein [Anaerolineae bacterium]